MGTENHILVNSTNDAAFGRALGQALNVTIPMAGGAFAVGSKYNAETNEAIRLVSLEAARNSSRDALSAQIATLQLSPELKADLEKRLSQLDTATTISGVRAIAASLRNEIREASERTTSERTLNDQEAREQRVQQLWSDIKKDLNPYLTETERKRREELEARAAAAATPEEKHAAEGALLAFDKNKVEEMSHSSDENARKAAESASAKIEELEQLWGTREAHTSNVEAEATADKASAATLKKLQTLETEAGLHTSDLQLSALPKLDESMGEVVLGELNSLPKIPAQSTSRSI